MFDISQVDDRRSSIRCSDGGRCKGSYFYSPPHLRSYRATLLGESWSEARDVRDDLVHDKSGLLLIQLGSPEGNLKEIINQFLSCFLPRTQVNLAHRYPSTEENIVLTLSRRFYPFIRFRDDRDACFFSLPVVKYHDYALDQLTVSEIRRSLNTLQALPSRQIQSPRL